MDDAQWLQEFYQATRVASEEEALLGLFEHLDEMVSAGDWRRCNSFLKLFQPTAADPLFGAGLLRFTFPFSKNLECWEPAFRNCYDVYRCQGLDSNKLFRGLLRSVA